MVELLVFIVFLRKCQLRNLNCVYLGAIILEMLTSKKLRHIVRPCETGKFSLRPYRNDYRN